MSWNEHHSMSEKLAVETEMARRAGEASRAEDLYKQAASEESAGFDALGDDKQRTRGITAVSAVALWYKGRDYTAAAVLAYRFLAGKRLPQFAEAQLRDLLQLVWTTEAAEKAGVKFVTGDVLVSVKGGEVIYGGAPLDLIIQKVGGIQAVLYRTVEMLLARPFRKRGGPPADIQSMFRPWLFQTPAGSYQFAVRMQEPPQRNLWEVDQPKVERVTSTFFDVLKATSTNPVEALPAIVPDIQYREAFLSLSRTLAPTGKTFERLEVRDASAPTQPLVTFVSATREELNSALRKLRPPSADEGKRIEIQGVLRGLHLDKDWLEVTAHKTSSGQAELIHIVDVGDVLDDVVGPMVNRRVVVTAIRRGSKVSYRDIELEE